MKPSQKKKRKTKLNLRYFKRSIINTQKKKNISRRKGLKAIIKKRGGCVSYILAHVLFCTDIECNIAWEKKAEREISIVIKKKNKTKKQKCSSVY